MSDVVVEAPEVVDEAPEVVEVGHDGIEVTDKIELPEPKPKYTAVPEPSAPSTLVLSWQEVASHEGQARAAAEGLASLEYNQALHLEAQNHAQGN